MPADGIPRFCLGASTNPSKIALTFARLASVAGLRRGLCLNLFKLRTSSTTGAERSGGTLPEQFAIRHLLTALIRSDVAARERRAGDISEAPLRDIVSFGEMPRQRAKSRRLASDPVDCGQGKKPLKRRSIFSSWVGLSARVRTGRQLHSWK